MKNPIVHLTTTRKLPLQIYRATLQDLPFIMEIIKQAQRRLRKLGIDQWQDGYPDEVAIRKDIANEQGYIFVSENRIAAFAAIIFGEEPTYKHIDGQWLSQQPYVVVHRIAVHDDFAHQGIAGAIFRFTEIEAKARKVASFRIDTHEDNLFMQKIIEKSGFSYCGIIQVRDGARRAYEKLMYFCHPKHNPMIHPNFSREQYELYALLYAADIDLKISEEELFLLKAEVEPEEFERILRIYKKNNDAEHIEVLKTFTEKFLITTKEKETFINSLESIFLADKKFTSMEMASFALLKKIILE